MSSTFAVIYTYTDDTALREATRPTHRDYLRGLDTLLVAGAWVPGEAPGGLLIFRAEDKAAVQAIVDEDPYTEAGVVADTQIREWAPPLGPLAQSFTE
jgi:uncharacterized protein YciI